MCVLPVKALRMLVDTARLAERFNMRSQTKPGKLDIKRRKPCILFNTLPIVSLFKLAILTSLFIFV